MRFWSCCSSLSLVLSGILAYLLFPIRRRRTRHSRRTLDLHCEVSRVLRKRPRLSRKLANRLEEAIWQKF